MYFWDIEGLKKDLSEKGLSEGESFKYLIINVVLYSLALTPVAHNDYDVYSALIMALISTLGVYYLYKCNNGSNGSNFLQKYLSINWVMGIRWIVYMIPVTILYYAITTYFVGFYEETRLYDVVYYNLIYMFFFWLAGKHFKAIASTK